jgi:hypothetical protein
MLAIREVQIPLVAALLVFGALAKLIQLIRAGAVGAESGSTVLFPSWLRGSAAIGVCLIEFGLGAGLILTAGPLGKGAPAIAVRIATTLLFVVATCALIELRASRPDLSCGCFGDLSTAPVSARGIARSTVLALASLATIGLKPVSLPKPGAIPELVTIFVLEMLLLGALSPEIGEALIRLGYSEPCELHDMPTDRTVTALRRSKQWRKTGGLIASDAPVDVWRELCWRYLVYPSSYADGQAEIVFAVSLKQRRPTVRYALVHAATGQALPMPGPAADGKFWRLRAPWARSVRGSAALRAGSAQPDMPFSSDL